MQVVSRAAGRPAGPEIGPNRYRGRQDQYDRGPPPVRAWQAAQVAIISP
jgi:hypothetical protein